MRQLYPSTFKSLIVFLLSFSISLTGFGQQTAPPVPIAKWQPLLFLDSIQIGSQFQYDPLKIASVDVVSDYYDSARHIHGKILIRSKTPGSFRFLGFADLARIYKMEGKAPMIFMLNDEFLKDTSDFKIDSSYVLTVKFIKGSEITYLKDSLPDLIIERIITGTKEDIDRKNRVMIRGK